MSDDEVHYSEEEIEDEEEAKSVASSIPASVNSFRLKRTSTHKENDEAPLTEAEKAMIAAKKRHEDDEATKLQEYEDRRRNEREREEEELRVLKEKQEQRRLQREEEEREQAERRRQEEERRKQEEEERKMRIEDERRKKEESKRLKQQLMGTGFVSTPPIGTGGRNFIIPEKKGEKEGGLQDKFGNIVQAKQEMGMTKEQQDLAKEQFLRTVLNAIQLSNLFGVDLKTKIKELHQRICKLETDKYDLEKRNERQTYDLKELNERQRQVVRHGNKRGKGKGADGGEASSKFPSKVSILSKYDRQIDRRNFSERRAMFDKKDAYPCFPNVPPPPTILERSIIASSSNGEVREQGEEDFEEEEEEE